MKIFKKKVLNWTRGLPVEGETKEELRSSLKARHWDLECELNQEAKEFYEMIEKLEIPEE